MMPERERNYHTTVVKKYPSFRDDAVMGCWKWLKGRRADDNAEGLWRVHDKLYNLKDFVEFHPGGKEWLTLTEGTDITEAFESYHITDKASKLLPRFYVRDALKPRNYKFTYEDDGFYRILKRRVAIKLTTINRNAVWKAKCLSDFDLLVVLFSAIAAMRVESFVAQLLMILICSQCLSWLLILSHNFMHQRNNWRMYTACLAFSSWRDWRVFHAISHHLYPNTYTDFEIRLFEPFFSWMPLQKKTKARIIFSYIATPIVYSMVLHVNMALRWIGHFLDKRQKPEPEELIPLLLPASMVLFGSHPITLANVLHVLKIWNIIIVTTSFLFTLMSVSAAHHGPHLIHEGDDIRELDFGIYQLSAVSDRVVINSSLILTLTHFGQHALHHMFPSLDHSLLPQLEKIFLETCEEFKADINKWTMMEAFKGKFQQMTRSETIRLK